MSNHSAVWAFDKAPRWDLQQHVGDLVFTFSDGSVEAPAQMWAWANPSVAEPLKRDALLVLEYGKLNRIARLTTPQWKAEEMDGWYMAALANSLCRRKGAYPGPAGTMRVFMTFGHVTGAVSNGKLQIDIPLPV